MIEQTMQRCFIITPIGGDRSDIRDALDGLLKNVLEPVLLDLGFSDEHITVAHQMKDSGSINTQLITRIIEDELCIVNLTGLNPNVMYELAIRHAVGKPVVIIAENGTKLPFDIIDQRTIFYHNTMLGAVQLKESLSDMVATILSKPDQTPDNPIIKIIKDNAILDKIKSDGKEHSELSLILNKISSLEERIVKNEKINPALNRKQGNNYAEWILEYQGNISIKELSNFFIETTVIPIVSDELTKKVIIHIPKSVTRKDMKEFHTYLGEKGVKITNLERLDISI